MLLKDNIVKFAVSIDTYRYFKVSEKCCYECRFDNGTICPETTSEKDDLD